MSNADLSRISVVKETTFATAVADPDLLELNFTSADLRMQTGKLASRLIRPDAQMLRGTKVSESAIGRIDGELQYDTSGAFFELLKASMRSAAETAATATVSPVTYTLNGSLHELSGTGVGTGMEVGDIVRLRSSADALVGYFGVTIVNGANLITIDAAPSVTSNLKVRRGVRIKNASTVATFNIEESHADATPDLHEVFYGMLPGRFTTNVVLDQLTTWSFDLVGSHSDKITDTEIAIGTGSRTAGPTTAVVKTTLPKVHINGETFCATAISAGWDLNAASRRCLDSQRARSIRTGKFGASGSATIYFEKKELYQAAINDTEARLYYVQDDVATIATDSGGNAIAFAFGNVQFGEATHPITGENTDIFLTLPWTAAVDSAELVTARILFFPAAN